MAAYVADTLSELNSTFNKFCLDEKFGKRKLMMYLLAIQKFCSFQVYLTHSKCYQTEVRYACSSIEKQFLAVMKNLSTERLKLQEGQLVGQCW